MFVSGLIKAQHPDEESRTSFLLEIAKLLPPLENTGMLVAIFLHRVTVKNVNLYSKIPLCR